MDSIFCTIICSIVGLTENECTEGDDKVGENVSPLVVVELHRHLLRDSTPYGL